MPICRTCNEVRPREQFSSYQLALRSKRCKPCQSRLSHSHYERNKSDYKHVDNKRKLAIRELLQSAKNVPCADCKQSYPYYVMEFDHVRGEKKFLLSKAAQLRYRLDIVQAELDKCDVVCSNCHAVRTHTRRAHE